MNKKSHEKDALADFRSAKTGKFVTEKYAEHHPATTVKEHNRLDPLKKPASS